MKCGPTARGRESRLMTLFPDLTQAALSDASNAMGKSGLIGRDFSWGRIAGAREGEPHLGQHIVLRHAEPVFVHHRQAALTQRKSLVGGSSVPEGSARVVLRNPHGQIIHIA